MIRNIIFDLGNVLISFKPAEFLARSSYSNEQIEIILNDVFLSHEWLELDNGDITLSEAIKSISGKSSLSEEELGAIFDLRTEIMFPIADNIKLLPELKKRGYRLYFLSNFPADIFPKIKNDNFFFKYFDGGIISAEVRVSKPERRIYEILLMRFSLKPEESVFIDDIEKNVLSAVETGMHGIHAYSPEIVSSELEKILSAE